MKKGSVHGTMTENGPIIGGLVVFLGLRRFEEVERILKDRGIEIDADDHALLKSAGANSHRAHKESIAWILDKGQYKLKHPQIALCGYCHCDMPNHVSDLLQQGFDPKEEPWEGAENAVGFCLHGDSAQCLKLITQNYPSSELESLIYISSNRNAPNCTIALTEELKRPIKGLERSWKTWAEKESFPKEVARTLASKLPTLEIQRLVKRNKEEKRPEINILVQELKRRDLQKKLAKESKGFSIH
jgi:hypothetical protein